MDLWAFLRANLFSCVVSVGVGVGSGADDDNNGDGQRERARRERRGHISPPVDLGGGQMYSLLRSDATPPRRRFVKSGCKPTVSPCQRPPVIIIISTHYLERKQVT